MHWFTDQHQIWKLCLGLGEPQSKTIDWLFDRCDGQLRRHDTNVLGGLGPLLVCLHPSSKVALTGGLVRGPSSLHFHESVTVKVSYYCPTSGILTSCCSVGRQEQSLSSQASTWGLQSSMSAHSCPVMQRRTLTSGGSGCPVVDVER